MFFGPYATLEFWQRATAPFMPLHQSAAQAFDAQAKILARTPFAPISRALSTYHDVMARGLSHYPRRPFNIHFVQYNGQKTKVSETVATDKTFMRGLDFKLVDDDGQPIERNVPKILLVAPLSGHFSTLLRNTVETLLPYADVRITDWKNAQNIPASAGKFDQGDYMRHLVEEMQDMGPEMHLVAVCQPGVPAIAAISSMSEKDDPNRPLSLSVMGSPIHPSANMTQPVELAKSQPMMFFNGLCEDVPFPNQGAGRLVYPGYRQLMAFVMMNTSRHMNSGKQYVVDLLRDDFDSAEKFRKFYDEYLAVMDMPAEFYLDVIQQNFKNEDLANGTLVLNGELINPAANKDVPILTVEGGTDDISAVGQSLAAHDLFSNLPAHMKFAHLQENAGHYGIFSGSKFQDFVAPHLVGFLHQAAKEKGIQYDPVDVPTPATHLHAMQTSYKRYNEQHPQPEQVRLAA
ncbi:MAG: polyhydroxyalkanoate depolymerase [Pseudomonadota bacterium]